VKKGMEDTSGGEEKRRKEDEDEEEEEEDGPKECKCGFACGGVVDKKKEEATTENCLCGKLQWMRHLQFSFFGKERAALLFPLFPCRRTASGQSTHLCS
jgi:hypothetical protein